LLEDATSKYNVQIVVDEVCLKFDVPRDVMLYEIFQFLF